MLHHWGTISVVEACIRLVLDRFATVQTPYFQVFGSEVGHLTCPCYRNQVLHRSVHPWTPPVLSKTPHPHKAQDFLPREDVLGIATAGHLPRSMDLSQSLSPSPAPLRDLLSHRCMPDPPSQWGCCHADPPVATSRPPVDVLGCCCGVCHWTVSQCCLKNSCLTC